MTETPTLFIQVLPNLRVWRRKCFDYEEMWNVNFNAYINKMTEIPEGYEIKIKNKTILVDKFTGLVLSVEET